RLPQRAGRPAGPEGDPLLRLEPLRRPARRTVGPVAGNGLGLALCRLVRPHHRRGLLRLPLALPGRLPVLLRLAVRPRPPRAGAPRGWTGNEQASNWYSADAHLAPGCSLNNAWDPAPDSWYWAGSRVAPCHTRGDKEIRNSPEKGPVAEPYLGPDWKCESYAN